MNFLMFLTLSNIFAGSINIPENTSVANNAVITQETAEVAVVENKKAIENIKAVENKKAIENKKVVEDNTLCFSATAKVEEEFGIEKHLLATIASVETGQWDYKREQYMAWPWTVNAKGKSYYLKSKEEAIAKVRELHDQGIESIDVGCMQINLKYHHNAFSSLEDAFDPQKNVEYSAKFLKKLYSSRGKDWNRAVMAYHSKIPSRGENYKLRIDSRYEQLKVAFNSKDMSLF